MASRIGIVLFRRDLRLGDHPALRHGCEVCDAVVPVFVWDPEGLAPWAPGGASAYWADRCLRRLEASLRAKGSRLIVRSGVTTAEVATVARQVGAKLVCWNRGYEPRTLATEAELEAALEKQGIETASFKGALLVEPWEVKTRAGGHFKVFTPFWKACQRTISPGEPLEVPGRIPAPKTWPDSVPIDRLGLVPKVDWAAGIRASWEPGEKAAHVVLEWFLDESLDAYPEGRDRMGEQGTSRLSPYLAVGALSPRQIWQISQQMAAAQADAATGLEAFLRQLFWREFSYHLLYHEPHTPGQPLRAEFGAFPWREDPESLKRWQRGRTGYPLVDAGMRELWRTGFMHNRARMVAASFLVKDLLIPWVEGARWFWDTLVDADLANNTMGWQWTAGCGADAAPYFRVFNPVAQGQRYDPEGAYIRQWVPEIAALPMRYLHAPWEAPKKALDEAGIELGKTYPEPLVDHAQARLRALDAYETTRRR